jgi:plasmid maintenance system antidote protein VapI
MLPFGTKAAAAAEATGFRANEVATIFVGKVWALDLAFNLGSLLFSSKVFFLNMTESCL